jgi:hypothetical protein
MRSSPIPLGWLLAGMVDVADVMDGDPLYPISGEGEDEVGDTKVGGEAPCRNVGKGGVVDIEIVGEHIVDEVEINGLLKLVIELSIAMKALSMMSKWVSKTLCHSSTKVF